MLRQKPLVSVIIPTYNSSETIECCLESLFSQTYKEIEVIVVDGYSTDSTVQICRKYPCRIFSIPGFQSKAKNLGILKSKGEFVFFVDADQFLSPKVIEECVKAANDFQTCAVISESSTDNRHTLWAKILAFEKLNIQREREVPRFFPKKALMAVGGFNPNLKLLEDWDLHDRITMKGARVTRVSSLIYHYEKDFSFRKYTTKYVNYGRTLGTLLKTRKLKAVARGQMPIFSLIRNSPSLFASSLLLSFCLFFLFIIRYACVFVGFLISTLGTSRKHTICSNPKDAIRINFDALPPRFRLAVKMLDLIGGETILDVGCGEFAVLEKHLIKSCEVIALDSNSQFLRKAKKLIQRMLYRNRCFFIAGSICSLPFKDKSVDAATMLEVMEHLPYDMEVIALKQVRRVLKEGGALIVSSPNDCLVAKLLDPHYFTGHRHYKPQTLKRKLMQASLNVDQILVVGGVINALGYIVYLPWHLLWSHFLGREYEPSMPLQNILDKLASLEFFSNREYGNYIFVKCR